MREVRGRRGKDDSLSKGTLLELLRCGIRTGISKCLEDSEVKVMKNKRYGQCKSQHAEVTIKSALRYWVKQTGLSKEEIEKEIQNLFSQQTAEDFCELCNCNREVVR